MVVNELVYVSEQLVSSDISRALRFPASVPTNSILSTELEMTGDLHGSRPIGVTPTLSIRLENLREVEGKV
jgi:hypothetical protein